MSSPLWPLHGAPRPRAAPRAGETAHVYTSELLARQVAREAHALHPARRARVYRRAVTVRGFKLPVFVVVTFPRPNAPRAGDPLEDRSATDGRKAE